MTDPSIHAGPTLAEVRSLLMQLLQEVGKIPPESITDGATIDGGLRMESVAFVELQVAIEDSYNIEIDPIEIVELGEFAAIVNYIHAEASRSS